MHKLYITVLLALSSSSIIAQQKSTSTSAAPTGKMIYTQRCMTCHQVDGAGAQNMIPPLIKTEYVLGNKTRLINIVIAGLSGEMKVNGEIYSNEMPPQTDLKDNEIAAVLTYIRSNFGNKAPAIKTAEVKKVRDGIKK